MCDEAVDPTEYANAAEFVANTLVKSGRALELQVVQAGRSAGGNVAHAVPYTDSTAGITREADVLMEFQSQQSPAAVQLVVECKNTKEHWVALTSPTARLSRQFVRHHLVCDSSDPNIDLLQRFWDGQTYTELASSSTDISSALVTAAMPKKNNQPDGAASALRQCLSAARGLCHQIVGGQRVASILVPVVVTNGPLWRARLDANNNISVEASHYERVRAPEPGRAVLIHIVDLQGLDKLLNDVLELQQIR